MKQGHQQVYFNYVEANKFLNKRWANTLSELSDSRVPPDLKPKEHTRTSTMGGGWGQTKLHLQPSVNNFLRELSDALRTQAKKSQK